MKVYIPGSDHHGNACCPKCHEEEFTIHCEDEEMVVLRCSGCGSLAAAPSNCLPFTFSVLIATQEIKL